MSRISYLILANSQRAGSTLVQRILNQRSNLFVWGESGDFLPNFGEIEEQALLFSADSEALRGEYVPLKSTRSVPETVFNRMQNLSPEPAIIRAAIEAGLREYGRIFHRLPGYDEVGFKAVRVTGRDVGLCCRAWPEAAKLLVFREPGAVYRSLPTSWRNAYDITPDSFSATWTTSGEAFLEYAHNNTSCHLIDYCSLVDRGHSLSRLMRLADLEFKDVEQVLAVRLNPTLPAERASDEDVAHVRFICGPLYDRMRRQSELPDRIVAHRNNRSPD